MSGYIEQGELKQIIVQRKDGSTWTAEIGLDGRLRYVKQLSDPDREVEQKEDQAPNPYQDQQDQQEAEEMDEGEPNEGSWGEEEGDPIDESTGDKDLDKLFEKLGHRGGQAPLQKPNRGELRRLSPTYHKKLKDPAFLSRLQSIMLDNKYARRIRGRTRGKLDMTRLFKVPAGARNVFMQKQERRGKEYNVVICVDQSGSMSGYPIELATETILFLVKQFEHLNINIGVIGYSDATYVYKELNNKKVNYDELYTDLNKTHGGTNDYPALRRGYHMLSKAPAGEKILLMLSDGSPGIYRDTKFFGTNGKQEKIRQLPNLNDGKSYGDGKYIDYNEREHLHHLVKANADVASIGIGIQDGGWQIPEHFVIQDVSDLKKTVLGVLRRQIKRG